MLRFPFFRAVLRVPTPPLFRLRRLVEVHILDQRTDAVHAIWCQLECAAFHESEQPLLRYPTFKRLGDLVHVEIILHAVRQCVYGVESQDADDGEFEEVHGVSFVSPFFSCSANFSLREAISA